MSGVSGYQEDVGVLRVWDLGSVGILDSEVKDEIRGVRISGGCWDSRGMSG